MAALQQALLMVGSSAPSCDPYYPNVSLLLHMDGANGSTTFTDNSPVPKTVTANGGAQVNTSVIKYGTGSYIGNGTSSYLLTPSSSDYTFGVGEFTIESWFYVGSSSTTQAIVGKVDSFGNAIGSTFCLYASIAGFPTFLAAFGSTWTVITSGTATPLNQWCHLAATRSGGFVNLFLNGILVGSATVALGAGLNTSAANVGIGRSGDYNGEYLNGYIDDLRITKGVARYTSNFTPPEAAFPNSGCTELVLVNPAIIPETLFAIQTYSSNIPNPVIVPEILSGIEAYSSNVPNPVIVPEILSGIETYSSNLPNPIVIPLTLD